MLSLSPALGMTGDSAAESRRVAVVVCVSPVGSCHSNGVGARVWGVQYVCSVRVCYQGL